MGTSKKLVLASLVSLMMVLALAIGLVPSRTPDSARAADQGRVDMVDLLNQILGIQAVDEILLSSSLEGVTVKTPSDNATTPPVIASVQATLTGGVGSETVHFVAYGDDEAPWEAPDKWNGQTNQVSAPVTQADDYVGQLDLGPAFYTAAVSNIQKAVLVYALVNATQAKQAITLQYEDTNLPAEAVNITLQQTAGDVDADDNGLPDDAFNDVAPGEIWVSTVSIDGQVRTVLLANLDSGAGAKASGTIIVKPAADLTLELPSLESLITAGVVASGESALAVIEVVGNLATLLDNVDGVATAGARQAWANGVNAIAPAAAALSSYLEVSLLYTQNSGLTYAEVGDLSGTGLSVALEMTGLDLAAANNVQLWAYPTMVDDLDGALILANDPSATSWRLVDTDAVAVDEAAGTINATLTQLSVFAPFDSGLALNSVAPARIPSNFAGADLTLTGVFPTATGLSIAQANAAYAVTVGGSTAPFRLGPAKQDVAITAYDGANPNAIYIDSPSLAAANGVEVTVTDLANAANTVSLVSLDVVDVYSVSVETRDNDTSVTTPGGVALSPGQSADLPADFADPAGKFFDGSAVSASLNVLGVSLVAWEINGVPAGNPGTLNFTVTQNTTITAVVEALVAPCTLSVLTQGLGVVALDPPGPSYPCGTLVTATATAADGYAFEQWLGAIGEANPTAETIQIVVDSDKEITAVFVVAEGPIWPEDPDALPFVGIGEVWLFGGLVAEINGTGFPEGTIIEFGNADDAANLDTVAATVFQRTPGGPGEIIIPAAPASWFANGQTTVEASITATDPQNVVSQAPNGLTYKQYDVAADGVATTAFIIDPTVTSTVAVWDGATPDNISLELPPLGTDAGDVVYGIARTVQIVNAKGNTEALGTSAFDVLLSAEESGDLIPASYDFSMHLYGPLEVTKNTPPAGSAAFNNASGLVDFGRTIDVNGNPVQTGAALLTYPVTGSGLTAGDVRDGLMMWGVELNYDYATEGLVPVVPQQVAYQSELLNDEVSPALIPATPNATVINLVDEARLYSLNGFSLRQGAVFDEEVEAGIRLDTANGTFTASSTSGGDALNIVSALGGLAWVDRVVFQGEAGKIGGTVTTFPAGSADGTDEYELALQSPASSSGEAGVVDLVIYLKSAPAVEAARLERVFEYKAAAAPNLSLLLILLGLLVAILGLAAGGDSGGGGGGPCFIATAAYGTPMASQIDVLRDMRDQVFLQNAAGSALVDTYYAISPELAQYVAQNPFLAGAVRIVLAPVVLVSRLVLALPMLSAALALMFATMLVMRRRAHSAR